MAQLFTGIKICALTPSFLDAPSLAAFPGIFGSQLCQRFWLPYGFNSIRPLTPQLNS